MAWFHVSCPWRWPGGGFGCGVLGLGLGLGGCRDLVAGLEVLGAFDADAGEDPAEPAGQVPGVLAQHDHPGGDEQAANDGGVQDDGNGQADAERLGPVIDSMAGSRVSAAMTATMTAIAAIRPMVVTSGMLATASDTSAMVTVLPVNTTAPPEVATARAIDSRRSRPSPRPRKCRVTMNSA